MSAGESPSFEKFKRRKPDRRGGNKPAKYQHSASKKYTGRRELKGGMGLPLPEQQEDGSG